MNQMKREAIFVNRWFVQRSMRLKGSTANWSGWDTWLWNIIGNFTKTPSCLTLGYLNSMLRSIQIKCKLHICFSITPLHTLMPAPAFMLACSSQRVNVHVYTQTKETVLDQDSRVCQDDEDSAHSASSATATPSPEPDAPLPLNSLYCTYPFDWKKLHFLMKTSFEETVRNKR